MTVKLTKARLGALAVLNGGPARYSNLTCITAGGRNVYWQSADWLIDNGLAARDEEDSGIVWITDAGRAHLRLENAGEFA